MRKQETNAEIADEREFNGSVGKSLASVLSKDFIKQNPQ